MKRFFIAGLATALFAIVPLGRGWAEEKPAAKTKKVEAKDITLNIPEGWKQKQGSAMRVAEFEIPPAGDDKEPGEYVVFFFGKGQGGDAQANITRWVGQFEAEGRKARTVTGESAQGKYTLVDLSGTYNKSIGPPVAGKKKTLPGWRVINVMIETDAGSYFLKLDGPQKTVAGVENEFRASFGAKKESEKEQSADKGK